MPCYAVVWLRALRVIRAPAWVFLGVRVFHELSVLSIFFANGSRILFLIFFFIFFFLHRAE